MRIYKPGLILVVLAAFSTTLQAQDYALDASDGATFYQLDFPGNNPPVLDSAVGLLETNLLRLRAASGIDSGYLNVVMNDNWVVRNLIVPLEQDYPYSHVSTQFDLGVSAGTDVNALSASVVYSVMPAQQAPAGALQDFPVAERDIATGGAAEVTAVAGASATPPNISNVLFGDITNNRSIFQLDHPNVEAALNQCYPMAVANSLQFLADTTDLVLPHSHVPGLRGDDSLVGQLDETMNRTAPSRTDGEGVKSVPGIDGKLEYLAASGLQGRIETRHWGTFSGNTSRIQTVDGRTATSSGGGTTIPFAEIVEALERGEDCEASYSFPGGAHAVDIVAAGYTNGQPWIIENSDINQSSDSAGAGPQGFIFSHLKDTDNDGQLNMNGKDELFNLICQRFIPEADPSETALPPPPGESFTIPGASLVITKTTDPANHSCCVDPPPAMVDMTFNNGVFTLSGNASWLPFNSNLAGTDFAGTNTATVAGFTGVNNSITGDLTANLLNAMITLGTNGALPGGQPISWDVNITPPDSWPWMPAADTNTGIKPRLRLNGFRHISRVPFGSPISLTLSMDAGDITAPADWFVAVQTAPGTFLSYSLDGTWAPGINPALQAPLTDVPNTSIFKNMGGLPQGEYTLYFAVDTTVNGQLDGDSLVYDSVVMVIE